jgi:hypothetical protein
MKGSEADLLFSAKISGSDALLYPYFADWRG